MVSIRLIKKEDLNKELKDIPISCHLPVFGGDVNVKEQVNQRLKVQFFNKDPELLKIHWFVRGEDEADGVWIDRS